METEETPLRSSNIVTSQTAHVKHNNHSPTNQPPNQPPTNQPSTNQPPTNPIPSTSGDGGQTQNKGGAKSGDGEQTQKKRRCPRWGRGTNPNKKEVLKVGMGDTPKTKEVPKVGTGDKPKKKEVPKVGTGDKPQISNVPKVGVGEIPMVPFEQPQQRNIKFEQDRKRCSMDTDGKNLYENKRVHRDTCVSDLVWPICKFDNTEYSKWFNIQILEAMTIFHQEMSRLMAWVQIVNYKDIILLL